MKLKCEEPLSNFAFKFNLRRFIKAAQQSGCEETIEYVRANGCPTEYLFESESDDGSDDGSDGAESSDSDE